MINSLKNLPGKSLFENYPLVSDAKNGASAPGLDSSVYPRESDAAQKMAMSTKAIGESTRESWRQFWDASCVLESKSTTLTGFGQITEKRIFICAETIVNIATSTGASSHCCMICSNAGYWALTALMESISFLKEILDDLFTPDSWRVQCWDLLRKTEDTLKSLGGPGAQAVAAVLFDPPGGRRDLAPSPQEGSIATGQIARSLGGVGGGQDFGANKGTLIEDRQILQQSISAKIAKGSSGPADDEHHNLIVGTLQSCNDDQGRKTPEVDQLVPVIVHEEDPVVAAPLTVGSNPNSNAAGRRREDDQNLVVSPTLRNHVRPGSNIDSTVLQPEIFQENQHSEVVEQSIPRALTQPCGKGQPLIAHALTAEGHDASEDGTGRGTPLVLQDVRGGLRDKIDDGQGIGIKQSEIMYTLDATSQHGIAAPLTQKPYADNEAQDSKLIVQEPDPQRIFREEDEPSIFEPRVARNGRGQPAPVVPPLKAQNGQTGKGDGAPCVLHCSEVAPTINGTDNRTGNERTEADRLVTLPMQVRRLTPSEAERLQGAPDGMTCRCGVRPDCPDRRIPRWLDPTKFELGGCGHSACGCRCPDSPRYRMLGNSVAVPVFRWLADRIRHFSPSLSINNQEATANKASA